MSYCRWSSNNWKCDLFCYEDVSGGITTHVAGNRVVGEVPEVSLRLLQYKPVSVTEEILTRMRHEEFKEWTEANERQQKFLDTCQRVPIGLPYDNQSFNDPTYEDFLARLMHLRSVGYRFPDYVIEEVEDDIMGEKDRKSMEKLKTAALAVKEARFAWMKANGELVDALRIYAELLEVTADPPKSWMT